MSESNTQTPAAAEPGPTAGTSAGVAESVAPAASSPVETVIEPVAAPVSETAPIVEQSVVAPVAEEVKTEERAPSLLSEAKTEEPKAEEVKPEEKKPEESKVEAKVEEVKPEPKPLPVPVYEKFALPEGVTLADEKLGAFTGILGEYENRLVTDPSRAHAVVQEMGQKMVDLYIKESQEQAERYTRLQRDNWDRTIETWRGEFRDDPEMGGNRADTSLSRMAGLLEMYGQKAGADRLSKLRDVFTMTGAGDNPEVLRFVNWAASRLIETPRPVAAIGPRAPTQQLSRAQRLYRNSSGAA